MIEQLGILQTFYLCLVLLHLVSHAVFDLLLSGIQSTVQQRKGKFRILKFLSQQVTLGGESFILCFQGVDGGEPASEWLRGSVVLEERSTPMFF